MRFSVQDYAEENLWLADKDLLILLYRMLDDDPSIRVWTTMPPQWAEEEIAEEVKFGHMIDHGNGEFEYTQQGMKAAQKREWKRVPPGKQMPLFALGAEETIGEEVST